MAKETNELLLFTVEISRGTMHDGPGLRDTVFVKGCPLKCTWCQNPESIQSHQEVWWDKKNCMSCHACANVCKVGALSAGEEGVIINRSLCTGCTTCTSVCPTRSITAVGKALTMNDIIKEVLKDKKYYEQFGGGVTVSGGEPLMQAAFVSEFFRLLKKEGIHTALDTCGFASSSSVLQVLPFTDHILFDIKIVDSERHKQFTGVGNENILENLKLICNYIRSERNENRIIKLWIRTPLIPGVTADVDNILGISKFIRDHVLDVLERWELCAFNSACVSKYSHLGYEYAFKNEQLLTKNFTDSLKEEVLLSGIPEDILLISGMIKE